MSAVATENPKVQMVTRLFDELRADNLDILDASYAEDCVFDDPITHVEGLAAIKQYYAKMYEGVKTIRFEYRDVIADGDRIALMWTMHMVHKSFKPDEELHLPGVSHIIVPDDKITRHRDYFDMGAMIYERAPILGGLIRKIKARLH